MERYGASIDNPQGPSYPNLMGWVAGTSCWYPITQMEDTPSCRCKGFQWRQTCKHIKAYSEGDYSVDMQFVMKVDNGEGAPSIVEGNKILNPGELTIEEVTNYILRTEEFLTKLLGRKVSFEQIL